MSKANIYANYLSAYANAKAETDHKVLTADISSIEDAAAVALGTYHGKLQSTAPWRAVEVMLHVKSMAEMKAE